MYPTDALQVKKHYKDVLLFFRVGSFYEVRMLILAKPCNR